LWSVACRERKLRKKLTRARAAAEASEAEVERLQHENAILRVQQQPSSAEQQPGGEGASVAAAAKKAAAEEEIHRLSAEIYATEEELNTAEQQLQQEKQRREAAQAECRQLRQVVAELRGGMAADAEGVVDGGDI
jgi:predicted  nucleic acid-binding Zn-ribbon protein